MVDLNRKVLGTFTMKEILGEIPPPDDIFRKRLDSSFQSLVKNIQTAERIELEKTLDEHTEIKRDLDKLTGAMALSREKIELVLEYLAKYINAIKSRLG
ncbi:MAG: hypothetical protein HZA84_07845 [Thaumarchaeota archaeon]|nr:hypothetical protein [Nitrososphaerota archaeon]